jgi:Ras GTPase-activating-like protein IQGAP2/3
MGSKGLVYFKISSPMPGTFIICFNHKGMFSIRVVLMAEKSRTLVEIDLKLDDLLEMQQGQVQWLDLRFVQLDVLRLIALLNRSFVRKKN